MSQTSIIRKLFTASGQVQGVGFRPFVYRIALENGLSGFVRNAPEGVLIEVQGAFAAVESFRFSLVRELPSLARIAQLLEEDLNPIPEEREFAILATSAGLAHQVLISPDSATCPDCLRELRDPGNRRFAYPFINCTNCGPRYSITKSMPYDRARTSMSCFPLCPDCAREYANPQDRRFHAQPNACPDCGPQLWFKDNSGLTPENAYGGGLTGARHVSGLETQVLNGYLPAAADAYGQQALDLLAERLLLGQIAAVKGLGGFHLVCDAMNPEAIRTLRRRKERPHKPLAVMVADLGGAEQIAELGQQERELLESRERPIVLCPLRRDTPLPRDISPDTDYAGLMLPYTPLHFLLLKRFAEAGARKKERGVRQPAALVMTSGNARGEPIVLGNREARLRLAKIADCFLLHNRDILIRTDDSVIRPISRKTEAGFKTGDADILFLRRARGFVPLPLPLPPTGGESGGAVPTVLGLGAELKNTICLTRGQEAFVSQHIGDLGGLSSLNFQKEIVRHLKSVLQVEEKIVVTDLHPNFTNNLTISVNQNSTRALQHHYAHCEAVLAENEISDPALVLALDGSGYASPDSARKRQNNEHDKISNRKATTHHEIWGGELLLSIPGRLFPERIGSLKQLALPGGDLAILEPWRVAHALLCENKEAWAKLPWLPEFERPAELVPRMLAKKINSPLSSGCGRVFDAAAAILGLCNAVTYEGQAAIRLEAAQGDPGEDFYAIYEDGGMNDPHPVRPRPGLATPLTPYLNRETGRLELDTPGLLLQIHRLRLNGEPVKTLARLFHYRMAQGLAELALAGVELVKKENGALNAVYTEKNFPVGLSGGVLQNMSLLTLLKKELRKRGLTPLTHRRLPPNDGCISFGQAVWGRRVK